MKIRLLSLVAASALVITGCSSKAPTQAPLVNTAMRTAADRALTAMTTSDFAAVVTMVDASTKTRMCGKVTCGSELTESHLRDVWKGASGALGSYTSHGAPRTSLSDGDTLFDYPLVFAKGSAHLQIRINAASKLTGWAIRGGKPTGNFGN